MMKTFSTKMNGKVLKMLDEFCAENHYKKSSFLEEIISEAVKRRAEDMEFLRSLRRGLQDELEGDLYSEDEVEAYVFGKKKAR